MSCKKNEKEEVTFTVSFNINFDGLLGIPSQFVKKDEKATKPVVIITPPGYTVVAWYKEAELINEWKFDTDVVTGNITLYAKWSDEFTVSFDSNGGSAVLPQIVKEGGRAVKPEDPTRNGDLFVAWYQDKELTNEYTFDYWWRGGSRHNALCSMAIHRPFV